MMMKSIVGSAVLVLASAAGCSVATDGAETSGLAEEALSGCHDSGTRFYVPAPNPDAEAQIKDLLDPIKLTNLDKSKYAK